jgi:4-carboxymuconolactone decarboxylase
MIHYRRTLRTERKRVMPLRVLMLFLALLVVTACSSGNALESTAAQETSTAAPIGAVVTEADIPSDIHRDSWSRLPLPSRDDLDEDGQRAYDVVVHPESRYADGLRGPLAMWMYSPLMAEHIFPASTYLRFGTEKDQRLTELAILATAREVRSQYEWSAHEPAGLRAGLEPEIIDLVRRRADLDSAGDVAGLGDQERTIIQVTREVLSEEKVSPDTFRQAIELFGERGVMDLAGLVGYYGFVNVTLKTFDVQLAPGRERLLPDLW